MRKLRNKERVAKIHFLAVGKSWPYAFYYYSLNLSINIFMAPLAFVFDGIKVYIYNEDHLPIHIHAQRNATESILIF